MRTGAGRVGLFVFVVFGLVGLRAAPTAHAQSSADDGLRFASSWVFAMDPAAGAIHAHVTVDVTNEVPDQYGAFSYRRAYFSAIGVPVLAEAAGVTAVRADDGRPLEVTIEATDVPEVVVAVVDLDPNLFYQETQQVQLSFELPGLAPRAAGVTRVNAAFADLIALVVGDPGLTNVEITVPLGYEIEVIGDPLERSQRDGLAVLSASAIADPDAWFSSVVIRDDDHLDVRTVEADGHDVEIRSWPGDTEWADFVARYATASIPALEDLIGQPWPAGDDVSVTETVSPYLYGYAGWYSDIDASIEVGDELDQTTVVHEISHAWFNSDWFTDRWIGEAFAQEYTARVLAGLGEPMQSPLPVDPAHPGVVRLVDWSEPTAFDDISEAHDEFAYNASWAVLRALMDEIGTERMAAVLDAVADRTIAYAGDPVPESTRTTGWRRLLDLLENVGGSTQAEQLFATHVTPVGDELVLLDRADARAAYTQLATDGAGWSPPFTIRRELSNWDFADARAAMDAARQALAGRNQVAELLAPLDLDVPTGMEPEYETARNPDDLTELTERWLGLAEQVVAAHDAVDARRGPLAAVGMVAATDPADRIDDALVALAQADIDAARADLAAAHRLVDQASTEGQRRVGALLALVLVLGVGRRSAPLVWQEPAVRTAVSRVRSWRGHAPDA